MRRLHLSFLLLFFVLPASASGPDHAELLRNLAIHVPGVEVSEVRDTPLGGVYEVVIGSDIYYMDRSARYVIDGDFIELPTKRNFTEETRTSHRKRAIESFGEGRMVVYTPKKVEHTITVVTDIDCPYCRKLHSEMDGYMKNNVKVRYIFMPLKGRQDYNTTVSVWCAQDRNLALDLAKSGADLDPESCENPIREHMALARELGVQGTPAIFLESGRMLPGYVPVDKLMPQLLKASAGAAG